MTFSEWKAKTMRFLIFFSKECEDQEIKQNIDNLIAKLQYLRTRDIANFMFSVHKIAKYYKKPELLNVLPSEEELDEFFKNNNSYIDADSDAEVFEGGSDLSK